MVKILVILLSPLLEYLAREVLVLLLVLLVRDVDFLVDLREVLPIPRIQLFPFFIMFLIGFKGCIFIFITGFIISW